MSDIAVIGVGAIGGVVAARLCAAGRNNVVLCVRGQFKELLLEGPDGTLKVARPMIQEPEEAGTSMLADRRLGLPLEVDARNGAVARIGARHGIATPLNKALAALLGAIHAEP
jgi:ketopantoate reductase